MTGRGTYGSILRGSLWISKGVRFELKKAHCRSLISIHKVYSTITPQAQQRLYKAAPCVSYACGGLL